MKNLSALEVEELGKSIGTIFREQYGFIKDEATMKALINNTVRDVITKSNSRTAPWGEQLSPMDIFNIEKKLYEPAGNDEVAIKLQKWNDDIHILTKALGISPVQLRSYKNYQAQWSELAKALNTATSGAGADWVPEGFSSQLIELVQLEAVVASKFQSFNMPTSPYTFPMLLGDGEAYIGSEPTEDTPDMYKASTAKTGQLTFTAKKLISRNVITEEMEEDSVVPVLPMLKRSIARAHAKAEDNAIINGDTTATHLDTGYTVAADDPRRAWNGLRDMCQSGMKQTGAAWSSAAGLGLIRGIREDMGIYGLSSNDLMILTNVNMYSKFKNVAEVLTMDNIGGAATILNGEISKIDGVELVLTQHVEEHQNASGVYDATTTTTTQFLMVYKPGFWQGVMREFRMQRVDKPERGVSYLVATSRRIWKPVYDTTTEPMIGWLYNVTK